MFYQMVENPLKTGGVVINVTLLSVVAERGHMCDEFCQLCVAFVEEESASICMGNCCEGWNSGI